jgi:NAD(P)-dependent dehydrogenase (short-subunit alcohol dehydrogenase family)
MSENGRQISRNARWDFSGSVVLITGAAQGQGRVHALTFAAAGADVVVCDLALPAPGGTKELAIEVVASECRAYGARALAIQCDVTSDTEVRSMIDRVVDEFGRLDTLVNNAGIDRPSMLVDLDEDEWDRTIDVNLKGVFLCSKYAAIHMSRAGSGSIVNIGSVASSVGIYGHAHYCASKHGVAGFSKALAVELAPHGVTVNIVSPTGVRSPMSDEMHTSENQQRWLDNLVRTAGAWNLFDEGQPLEPEEITHAVMWLASDTARHVTGTDLTVDAGYTAK